MSFHYFYSHVLKLGGKENLQGKYLFIFLWLSSVLLGLAGVGMAGISLLGSSGLVNIPTAEIVPDRNIYFGFSYIPKPYAILGQPGYSNTAYYCSIGYLPFLELNFRITRIVHWKHYTLPIGDRMASFRVRLIAEKALAPALAFGVQDIISLTENKSSRHFNAFYLVGFKTLLLPGAIKTRVHLGYGTDWMKADKHHLVGVFGGLDVSVNKHLTLIAEYDTEKVNLGARLSLMSHFHLMIAYLNARRFSGGINLSFSL